MRQACFTLPAVLSLTFALTSQAAAQSMEVVAAGDTMSYATFGNGRTTILLVHGWSNNRTFWEPHVSTLAARYRVVTVDLASFGESTSHRSDWSMSAFADDLEAVLDDIDADEVVAVGFSMGAAAVVELSSRGRSAVIGAVLVDILHNVEDSPTDEEIDDALAK